MALSCDSFYELSSLLSYTFHGGKCVPHHCSPSAWSSGCPNDRRGGMFLDEQQQLVRARPPEAGGDRLGAACHVSSHQLCVCICLILTVLPSPFNRHSVSCLSSSFRKKTQEDFKSVIQYGHRRISIFNKLREGVEELPL